LISLFVASILLMSLAAELATARPAREPIAWGLLLLAVLIAVCLAVVGTRVGDLGIGDQLAEAGCLCAILGSGLWISSVRRLRPQRSGAFA
jgi:high-affinity Fe2+/Pb2+ permease